MARAWLILTVVLAARLPTVEPRLGPVCRETGFAPTGAGFSQPPAEATPSEVTDASVEERASQVPNGLETPLLLSLLVACVLMVVLFRLLWSPKAAARPPEVLWDEAGLQPPRQDPSHQLLSLPAFLDELRRREETAEAARIAQSGESAGDLIELHGDDVRSVDE